MADLKRYRGDTNEHLFRVQDSKGVAIDITGWTFQLTVDSAKDPIDEATQKFKINGTLIDVASGLVEFVPSLAQANQTPGVYYYDVQATMPNGRKVTLAKGKYTFIQDINKS